MIALVIAKKELIRNLKNKKKLILTLLVPLLSILVAIGANSLMKPSIHIGVIGDEAVTQDFMERVNPLERIQGSLAHKDTIHTDMILAKYLGVVVFKAPNVFEVACLDENMKSQIEEAIGEVCYTGKTNKLEGLISILEAGQLNTAQRGIGFVLITLMISCTLSAATLLNDKEEGILTRFVTSPHLLRQYILGNYIYNMSYTMIQILIAALLMDILKIDMGIGIQSFILLGIIIAMIASSMATLFVVLSKSELQASLMASSCALLMALLGGAFLPVAKMPEALRLISQLSVTKWMMELATSMEMEMMVTMIVLAIAIVVVSMAIGEKKLLLNR